jgi:DNA mismatch repair protein MSH4
LIRISNKLLNDILLESAKEIDVIYHLIGVIIDLDIAQSLAEIAKVEEFCRPTFTRVLRLEDAYHPMLQGGCNKVNVIKNNVIATPQYNFYLITGPNMSGKTVYIKMIAIIQIMAQIGSYLPASKASIRLCDKIFSRLGFQDNIEQNASSFSVELRDMDYIYNNLTPNSLVIMDELCRSTDPQVCSYNSLFYSF